MSVYTQMDFKKWPLSLSAGHALQLVRMSRGELFLPPVIRDICYTTPPAAAPSNSKEILANADIVLVEMSTPIEIYFGDFIFNQNRLREYVNREFEPLGKGATDTALRWISSLWRGDMRGIETFAASLRKILIDSGRADGLLFDMVENVRQRHLHTAEMIDRLSEVRSLLPIPMGIVLHNFNYVADGRPVIWPSGFKDETIAAARELGVPTYDPGPLVAKVGVGAAMAADLRHYQPDFNEAVADEYVEFASSILGRPLDNGRSPGLKPQTMVQDAEYVE